MSAPAVSVIIPTKDRPALLKECLAPLLSQHAEIVVALDGINDPSHTLVVELAKSHPQLKFVVAEGGRSGARQAGVEAATGDVVLLLDDDVIAHPGLVAGHAQAHTEPGLVVLGYMPVTAPNSAYSEFYAAEYENACERYEQNSSAVLGRLWGGNVSLRRADALRVGLVSEGFERRYHEDTDFGFRCQASGLSGRFDRTLRADHRHQRDLSGFLRDARSQGEGRALLAHRYPDRKDLPLSGPFWHLLGRFPIFVAAKTTALKPLTGLPVVDKPIIKFLRRMHRSAGEQFMTRRLS